MPFDRQGETGPGASPGPAFSPTDAVQALGLVLRAETEEDIPFLRRLYISMRWDELAPVEWSDEQKVDFLEQQFDAQRTHYLRAYGDADFLIVERGGQAVGRLYVFRGRQDIRIVDIGMLPEFRSQGFGTALMQALFAEGTQTGRTVSVHVEVFNPARQLYGRLGFREIGEHGPYRLMEWRPPAQTA